MSDLIPVGSLDDVLLRCLSAWHAELEQQSKHTARSYRDTAKAFIEWLGDVHRLRLVAPSDVRAFLSMRAGAPATLRTRLAGLRSLFSAIVADGVRGDNPAASVKFPRAATWSAKHTRAVPVPVLLSGLAGLSEDADGIRDRALLLLMTNAGLRRSEVAGLRLADVHDEYLDVRGKGGKQATVFLGLGTKEALQKWLAWNENGERVFPMTPESVGRIVKRRLGDEWTAHGLRARGITDTFLRSGKNSWLAQVFARHSSPQTTDIYIEAERGKEAAMYAPDYR